MPRCSQQMSRLKPGDFSQVIFPWVQLCRVPLLLMGQARPGRTLEAQELVLRDSAGRMRALLSASPEPHLTLFDTKEQMRADMSARPKEDFLPCSMLAVLAALVLVPPKILPVLRFLTSKRRPLESL